MTFKVNQINMNSCSEISIYNSIILKYIYTNKFNDEIITEYFDCYQKFYKSVTNEEKFTIVLFIIESH